MATEHIMFSVNYRVNSGAQIYTVQMDLLFLNIAGNGVGLVKVAAQTESHSGKRFLKR